MDARNPTTHVLGSHQFVTLGIFEHAVSFVACNITCGIMYGLQWHGSLEQLQMRLRHTFDSIGSKCIAGGRRILEAV